MTGNSSDRRKKDDRRSGIDRRSGGDRRSGTDRRSGQDRRSGWGPIKEHRFQGVVKTTATLSHLLGQPLTVITGYVDLLSESTNENYTKEKLAIIKGQLELINNYMKDLRDIREYKTMEFAGVTLLDIESTRTKDDD
ncbi:MAG: histidine kinase dimerization/phospho-acceptor domain-containing protein [Deltaproteobacteria bacterium]|jgi:signal transduction histidine kinase